MRAGFWALGASMVLIAGACSSSQSPGMKMPPVLMPMGGSTVTGAAGMTANTKAPTAGSSASTTTGMMMPVTMKQTGAAGTTAAASGSGAAGAAGSNAAVAGAMAVAGTGGEAGGGTAGASAGSGMGFVREADPTMQSITTNGEYTVKSYTELDGLVGGDAYGDAANAGDGSELYYPVEATPPFAGIVIVPGFTAQRSDVAPWGPFLASHGIVALVIDTNSTSDQPDVRSAALVDALDSLKKENMRDGSPIKGNIDTSRLGIMGWSMGGGGTWITADSHPELKVAVSLCGWITQPVGSMTKVPSLQFAARDDGLAAGMSQPVYNAIPDSTPKKLIEFIAPAGAVLGGHFIANDPANMDKQVGAFGLSWIKVFLEGDERYRQFFSMMPMQSSDQMTNQ